MRVLLGNVMLLLVFLCAFGGCAVQRTAIDESIVEIPASYAGREGAAASAIGRWWEAFRDEQLNALMEEAFSRNLDIAQSYERLQQSMALVRIADAARGFTLRVDGSGGRNRQSNFVQGITAESGDFGATTFDTYTLSAAASYEVDLWEKLASRTRASRLEALAAEQDLKALYIGTSAQLADVYFIAVEQRAQLALSDQVVISFEETLRRVEERYREGLVPALDVYQSRQNLASARARRPLHQRDLAAALNAISVLTGQFPERDADSVARELMPAPPFPAGLPSQLLVNRPDIRSAYLRLKASDERTAAAIADRLPALTLTGGYGGTSSEVKSILRSPHLFWNILLQAAQPLLDAGRREAEVTRNQAILREHMARYHRSVLTAFQEVEDALEQGKAAEERIDHLEERVSVSERELRITLDNYLQGLAEYLPVLTAQQRFYEAKSVLLTTRRQLLSARVQLARAVGGGWVDGVMRNGPVTEE